MPATSRCSVLSEPTAPSISSSVPSRMFASGVLSSCDMCRRNLLRSSEISSSRTRSHSSWRPSACRSVGPGDRDGLVEPAVSDVADGLVDLPDRPGEEHREHHDQCDRDRHQRGGLPEQPSAHGLGLGLQLLELAVGLAARQARQLPGVACELVELPQACGRRAAGDCESTALAISVTVSRMRAITALRPSLPPGSACEAVERLEQQLAVLLERSRAGPGAE